MVPGVARLAGKNFQDSGSAGLEERGGLSEWRKMVWKPLNLLRPSPNNDEKDTTMTTANESNCPTMEEFWTALKSMPEWRQEKLALALLSLVEDSHTKLGEAAPPRPTKRIEADTCRAKRGETRKNVRQVAIRPTGAHAPGTAGVTVASDDPRNKL